MSFTAALKLPMRRKREEEKKGKRTIRAHRHRVEGKPLEDIVRSFVKSETGVQKCRPSLQPPPLLEMDKKGEEGRKGRERKRRRPISSRGASGKLAQAGAGSPFMTEREERRGEEGKRSSLSTLDHSYYIAFKSAATRG